MQAHVIAHPLSLAHDPGPGHPDSPQRVVAILEELRSPQYKDLITWHEAVPATREELLRAHAGEYLDFIKSVGERGGGRLDEDTVMSPDSYAAALVGAGAAAAMARFAMKGEPAFAAVRPPGHHALRDRAMGFCLINNVVVAAYVAVDELGASRVLIVDWDVHHGNGTQAMVETDPRIRYVSLHQWPLYPGTGRADERGVGNI